VSVHHGREDVVEYSSSHHGSQKNERERGEKREGREKRGEREADWGTFITFKGTPQ
jgi:hypothetical protein